MAALNQICSVSIKSIALLLKTPSPPQTDTVATINIVRDTSSPRKHAVNHKPHTDNVNPVMIIFTDEDLHAASLGVHFVARTQCFCSIVSTEG